jgi:hypothetical protein
LTFWVKILIVLVDIYSLYKNHSFNMFYFSNLSVKVFNFFLLKVLRLSTVFFLVFSFLLSYTALSKTRYAEPVFDSGLVFSNAVFYSLPERFSSKEKIQFFLESKESVLANYMVEVSFAQGDRNLDREISYPDIPDESFLPENTMRDYLGQKILFSEFLWLLTRTDFGNACGTANFDGKNLNSICYDNTKEPINPAFVLALIQKESGLVYGDCAKVDADTNPKCRFSKSNSVQKLQFRLDRAVGYFCFESSDKSKGCWDENPNWVFFKGVFRQVYFATRLIRIRQKTCEDEKFAFSNFRGLHVVGAKMDFAGESVTFKTSLACSLYIYTPHVQDKKLFFNVFRDIGGLDNFRKDLDIPNDYEISPIF